MENTFESNFSELLGLHVYCFEQRCIFFQEKGECIIKSSVFQWSTKSLKIAQINKKSK